MALPVPNLDDRDFQGLVNDAKLRIQARCPEWSDHNVSDPGVTLIEQFAWMTDQLIYRLNRVPDRLYVKFLELIDVQLFPPTAARTHVTFWLTGPQAETIVIPRGTQVATVRTERDDAVGFSTEEDLSIVPSSLATIGSMLAGGEFRSHDRQLAREQGFACFDAVPKTNDALYIGLPQPVPSNAVTLRFGLDTKGVGVEPKNPPLIWEASDGVGWVPCELDEDGTGGLNRNGDVVLHVPPSHATYLVKGNKGAWLRARVTPEKEDQPRYGASPQIRTLSLFTIGGTVEASNVEFVEQEDLGISTEVPGQRFALERRPLVLGGEPPTLEVAGKDGWEAWTRVESFADSGPADPHYRIDPVAGEVVFGPGVRESDGSLRQYGMVPPKGVRVRIRRYRTGGGTVGNVAAGALTMLKSSIPFVGRVENRRPARGGVEGEDIENAKVRGPIKLRSRGRAVTAEDYEYIAREAAPELARVQAVPAEDETDAGGVRLLIVPSVVPEGRLELGHLTPSDSTVAAVKARIEETRVIGTRVEIERPYYQGVSVVATLRARPRFKAQDVRDAALDALFDYFDPIRGGPDRTGWPFGRPVHIGEIFSLLQRVPGTEFIEEAQLFPVDLDTGKLQAESSRIEIDPNWLVMSFKHDVQVTKP